MNQGEKTGNGLAARSRQTYIKNSREGFSLKSAERTKFSQSYLFENNVRNRLLRESFEIFEQNFSVSADIVYLNKSDYLYQPDDEVRYLYLPESAVISEFQILENGKSCEVLMVGREGAAGISSFFGSQPAQNFSQVLIPGRAWRISARLFRQRMNDCKYFQKNVFNFINSYLSQISQRIVCSIHHSTEERLCLWLLMINERCGKDVLQLTHEQIARFLGVHRPSVTLITQALRNKGIISYVRGKISITDHRQLENSCCDCYSTMLKN